MELTKEENEILNLNSTANNSAILDIEYLQKGIDTDHVRLRKMYEEFLMLKRKIDLDGLEFQYTDNKRCFYDIQSLKYDMREIKNSISRRQETLDLKLKQLGDCKWIV